MQTNKGNKEKVILGVDPGTTVMGYGILLVQGKKPQILQYGVVHLSKYQTHAHKLKKIYKRILQLVQEYHPDEIALEAPFYGKNIQSMLKLGRAQGVAMTVALSKDIPIVEYAPKKIKHAITGNGNASKEQVAKMLMTLLDFKAAPNNLLDATDALGVALCHFYLQGNVGRKSKSWNCFISENPSRVR